MQTWKTLERKKILNYSKFLTVESHTIELSDGRIIRNWPWIVTPDYVNVIAVTVDRMFLCFRQTKYGVKGVSLAPVGGYIEPDEDAISAGKRELMEETGYEASDWVKLGKYRVDSNRGVGTAHLFLAIGARQVASINSDDLEEQELLQLSRDEMEIAITSGEFKVLGWAAVAALALFYTRDQIV